jgi:serine/threonine protein kinase
METDMCKYITNSRNHYLDEDTCKMLLYQVIIALRHLHENNYGHLDVKCENILITLLKPIPDDTNKSRKGDNHNRDFPLVKLADFGYSRIIGEHSFRKTRVGTVRGTEYLHLFISISFFREFTTHRKFIEVKPVIID